MSVNANSFGQFLALGVLALFVVGLIALVVVLRRGNRRTDTSARLVKLDRLLASGEITSAERERQRAAIISAV